MTESGARSFDERTGDSARSDETCNCINRQERLQLAASAAALNRARSMPDNGTCNCINREESFMYRQPSYASRASPPKPAEHDAEIDIQICIMHDAHLDTTEHALSPVHQVIGLQVPHKSQAAAASLSRIRWRRQQCKSLNAGDIRGLQIAASAAPLNHVRSATKALSRASISSSANIGDVRRNKSFGNVLQLSLVELANLEGDFNPCWIQEFRELYFNPLPLQRLCYVVCFGSAALVVSDYLDRMVEKGSREALGIALNPEASFWLLLKPIGYAIPGATSVISFSLLSSRCLRRFSTQNYDGLVILSLFFLGLSCSIVSSSLVRLWGVQGVSTHRWARSSYHNLTYNVSFSENGLPKVSCRDTNAAARLLEVNLDSMSCSNGCEPSFFCTSNLLIMFTISVMGSLLHCGPKCFAGFVIANFISCYVIQSVTVGTPTLTVTFTMCLLLLVGLQDAMQCYFIEQHKKNQFTALKINHVISEYQTKLVHTLIPPNVLQFVSSRNVMQTTIDASTPDASSRPVQDLASDLSGEIPIATVMFCSVECDLVTTTTSFDNMSNYLDGLDKLVETSGMFKYQHISTGKKLDYVVSCPRAACPFDIDQQAAEYPGQACYEMIKLGWNLMEYTQVFSQKCSEVNNDRSLVMKMKVGMNCGPLAGIVLGKYRRFYCLFGDTMNVSARMCSNAKQGAICVTPDVARRLVAYQLCMDHIVITSRGIKDIKGKGPMELFDVSVTCQSVIPLDGSVPTLPIPSSTQLLDLRKRLRIIEESTQESIYAIRSDSLTFENVEIEAEFLQSQVYIHRAGLTGALCLYSLFALWQMYLVTLPDEPAYFKSHGLPEIEWRMKITTILLYTRVTVMFVTSALLIIWMWRFEIILVINEYRLQWGSCRGGCSMPAAGRQRRVYEKEAPLALDHRTVVIVLRCFMCLVVFLQGLSVATAEQWPKHIFFLSSFSSSMTLHFGMSHCANGLTFKQNLVLVVYALILLAQSLMKLISGQMSLSVPVVAILVLQVVLNLGLARNLSWCTRKSWLNLRVLQKSTKDLGQILFDLIPPVYALQLIKNELTDSKILFESGDFRVVALQLDICGFTQLSSSLSPASLANAVHKLFSDFDDAVLGRNIFKVDTIGDAYIVVGWLHRSSSQKAGSFLSLSLPILKEGEDDSEAPDDELDDVNQCADILSLAGELLEIINCHRHTSSIPWDARIGISLGNVVAGMLGDRQKRFSVQGEAMEHIAQLEPQGQPGKVHCSAVFFDLLSKSDVGQRLLKCWVVEKVGLGNSQETSSGQVEAGSYLLSSEENDGNTVREL